MAVRITIKAKRGGERMQCTSVISYKECLTPEQWNYPNITRPFSILYYVLGGCAFYRINGTEHRFEKAVELTYIPRPVPKNKQTTDR